MSEDFPADGTLESQLEHLRRVQRRSLKRWVLRTILFVLVALIIDYFGPSRWLIWFMVIVSFLSLLIHLCIFADTKRKILAHHNPNSFDA